MPHIAAVVVSMLLPSLGFLGPLVVALRNQQDAEVVYQARQAAVFHLCVSATAWSIALLGTLLTCFIGLGPAVLAGVFVLTVGAITSVVATLRVLGGNTWRYPLVGGWVRPSPELLHFTTPEDDQRAGGDSGSS